MTTEQQFDAIYNEGGEGFNPIRAAREDREAKEEAARPVTRSDRKRQIYHRLNVLGTRDYPGWAEEREALYAEVETIEAEENAEFAAAWTLKVTTARRASWNARVASGQIKTGVDVARETRSQGWLLNDLKQAVRLHGI